MILAGDIGGTKTRLALADASGALVRTDTYRTTDYPSASALVGGFLAAHGAVVQRACVGVAGPVFGGRVTAINLPWAVDSRALAAVTGLPSVALVNDLEANARGIETLGPDDLAVLNPGALDEAGNRAVVSAGTGLGECMLWWDGERHHAVAGEGGHADFAPRTEIEIALLRHLTRVHGRVSYDRVLSGSGLAAIYRFLGGFPPDADIPEPAEISAQATADARSLGGQALDVFVSIYGARAGNVALAALASGGVYLGGGIAPKILPHLIEGGFMLEFVRKGRLAPLLARMPVRVVLNDHAALLGAARIAAEQPAPPTTLRLARSA